MLQTLSSAGAALAGVVLLVLLIGRVAKAARFSRAPTAGRMRVVETLALDPRRKLVLVRCDGRTVLLLTGAQDQVVGWLAEQAS